MRERLPYHVSLLFLSLISLPGTAHALLVFNEGKDQVFTTATYSWGYDTNVFARSASKGTVTQALSFGASYTRKAGLIGVSALFAMNAGQFAGLPGQNFADPGFTLGFNKGKGRTTGDLTFQATKVNSPDPVANDRAVGWTYSAILNLRYPVIERFYITNSTNVGGSTYQNKQVFAAQKNYSDNLLVNFIYDSKLDINGGYRLTLSQTSDTTTYNHAFNIGSTGAILPQLSGTISAGYSLDQTTSTKVKSATYTGFDASVNLSWKYSRLLTFSGTVDKDFGISSTDIPTDTTAVGLALETTLFKRFKTSLGVTNLGTDFLGPKGGGRRDTLWEFAANVGTAITTHIRTNLAYGYMINDSTVSIAQFVRETVTLSVTATY